MMATKKPIPKEYRCWNCRAIGDHWREDCKRKKHNPRPSHHHIKQRQLSLDAIRGKYRLISLEKELKQLEEVSNLKDEIQDLKDTVIQKTKQIHVLEIKEKGNNDQANESMKTIKTMRNHIHKILSLAYYIKEERDNYQQSLSEKDSENKHYQNELKSLKQENESLSIRNQQIAGLQRDLDQEREQHQLLKQSQLKFNTKYEAVRSQNESLLAEKSQLLQSMKSSKTMIAKSMEELNTKISTLHEAYLTEKQALKIQKEENLKLKDKVRHNEEQLEYWIKEAGEHSNNYHELQVQHGQISHEKYELNEELNDLTTKLNQAKQTINNMKRMLANKMEEWKKSTEELGEKSVSLFEGLTMKNKEIEQLKQERSELNASINAIEVDRDHHRDLLSKLKPLLYKLNDQVQTEQEKYEALSKKNDEQQKLRVSMEKKLKQSLQSLSGAHVIDSDLNHHDYINHI